MPQQTNRQTLDRSVVIDHLLEDSSTTQSIVGFLYFDYKSQTAQSALAMLLSLLKQFVMATESLPKCVKAAFETHQKTQNPLSIEDARRLLLDVAVSCEAGCYIIIDAIDECGLSQRRVFLEALSELAKTVNVHLMITGRPYVEEVNRYFPECKKLEISADDGDLRRYIHHGLSSHDVGDMIDDELGQEIADRLVTASRGMFLLPALHLRTLVDMTSVGEIYDALGSLSESLSEAYRTTISRIQNLGPSRSELGLQVLQWVCFSMRPLTVDELQDILCVKYGQTTRDIRYRPILRMMLECCQGLILVDPETSLVRPAHFTVQEHIVDNASTLFPRRDVDVAKKCLTYLSFQDFTTGPVHSRQEIEARIGKYPFLSYAASYWHAHVHLLGRLEEIEQLLWAFLGSEELTATARQVFAFLYGFVKRYYDAQECLSHTALHTACLAGLTSVVRRLMDDWHSDSAQARTVNAQTYIGTTPVMQAASCGLVEIVQILLAQGADPYIENRYGNALHCAAEAGESGESGTIRVLVKHGMSPTRSDARYSRVPLHCTLDRDSVDAFETLLSLGASIGDALNGVGEGDGCHGSRCGQCSCCFHAAGFLHLAVDRDAGDIIRVIASRKPADLNSPCQRGASPLF